MTDDPIAQMEAARAATRAQMAEAQDRRADLATLATRLEALSAQARSPRGEVTVTASAGGEVTDIELSDDATDLGATDLSELIVETIGAAQRSAAQAAADAASEVLGQTSFIAADLRADADRRFPDDGTVTYR